MLVNTVKFNFILKSGKEFSAIAYNRPVEETNALIEVVKQTFQNGTGGFMWVENSLIRLDDCSVIDWEQLDLKEVEDSATEEPSPY